MGVSSNVLLSVCMFVWFTCGNSVSSSPEQHARSARACQHQKEQSQPPKNIHRNEQRMHSCASCSFQVVLLQGANREVATVTRENRRFCGREAGDEGERGRAVSRKDVETARRFCGRGRQRRGRTRGAQPRGRRHRGARRRGGWRRARRMRGARLRGDQQRVGGTRGARPRG